MANKITSKGVKGGYIVARFDGSGAIWPNNSGTMGANSAGETVNEMAVTQIIGSTSNGVTYSIARGANTVFNFGGNDVLTINFQEQGMPLEQNSFERAANVVITKSGAGVSSLVIKLHKSVSITSVQHGATGSQY